MEVFCYSCQKPNTAQGNIGFRDECIHCGADLHICKNCEFYDTKVYNECRETSADVVREKERANFCDFFTPCKNSTTAIDEKARLKAAADMLFKK